MLRTVGEVVNINHGNWRLPENGEVSTYNPEGEEEEANDGEALGDEPGPSRLKVECQVGAGPDVFHVYYYERDRRLAGYESRSTWPCKVGFSTGAFDARILGQGVATAHHSPPVVGLVIRTECGRSIEKAIHHALRMAGRAVPDSPGTEWFETAPDTVRRWFEEYQRSLRLLEQTAGHLGRL
jgi:hypothetical protein